MGNYSSTNKLKIINDPVYGFIKIPYDLIFDLIEHPLFQRLRRIRQLGLTHFVYPGANHTRFQHAVGAMHLMGLAIEVIRSKGHTISDEEARAVTIAILLHDIGHGPFSHSLEHSLIKNTTHEEISLLLMEQLNKEFRGELSMAIEIFRNRYPKKFLHQLVSSQLDMDRLDYLKRDSFFTGVTEGVIGSDRIIKMLNVLNDQLVVEEKGIYSIEKFLIARRLMYWQVYLHRTVVASEQVLVLMLKRAQTLTSGGEKLFATPALAYFLQAQKQVSLEQFSLLDDDDILASAKVWCNNSDRVLSMLANGVINRKLFSVELDKQSFSADRVAEIRGRVREHLNMSPREAEYLVVSDSISNYAYSDMDDRITIMDKHGNTRDIAEASDILNISVLSKTVRKYFLCYPRFIKEKE
ncbi:MAG: phosphohydrolase [Bacteroidetes bacterium]|nr:MAG: phosphohydrolase [Bacteroidota bacterium]RLD95966.1 MAG: phosphohydrolase [Bacteroidota bacterium]